VSGSETMPPPVASPSIPSTPAIFTRPGSIRLKTSWPTPMISATDKPVCCSLSLFRLDKAHPIFFAASGQSSTLPSPRIPIKAMPDNALAPCVCRMCCPWRLGASLDYSSESAPSSCLAPQNRGSRPVRAGSVRRIRSSRCAPKNKKGTSRSYPRKSARSILALAAFELRYIALGNPVHFASTCATCSASRAWCGHAGRALRGSLFRDRCCRSFPFNGICIRSEG